MWQLSPQSHGAWWIGGRMGWMTKQRYDAIVSGYFRLLRENSTETH